MVRMTSLSLTCALINDTIMMSFFKTINSFDCKQIRATYIATLSGAQIVVAHKLENREILMKNKKGLQGRGFPPTG